MKYMIISTAHLCAVVGLAAKALGWCPGACIEVGYWEWILILSGMVAHLGAAILTLTGVSWVRVLTWFLAVISVFFIGVQVAIGYTCLACIFVHIFAGLAAVCTLYHRAIVVTSFSVALLIACTRLLIAPYFVSYPTMSSVEYWPKDGIGGGGDADLVAMIFLNPECPPCRIQYASLRDDFAQRPWALPMIMQLTWSSERGRALVTMAYAASHVNHVVFLSTLDQVFLNDQALTVSPDEALSLLENDAIEAIGGPLRNDINTISERMQSVHEAAILAGLRAEPTTLQVDRGGRVYGRWEGLRPGATLRSRLDEN